MPLAMAVEGHHAEEDECSNVKPTDLKSKFMDAWFKHSTTGEPQMHER